MELRKLQVILDFLEKERKEEYHFMEVAVGKKTGNFVSEKYWTRYLKIKRYFFLLLHRRTLTSYTLRCTPTLLYTLSSFSFIM